MSGLPPIARLAAAALAVAFVLDANSAAAATQMFKCITGNRTVYQQQACPVTAESPASGTATGPAAKAASAPRDTAQARRVKPASRPASGAPATRR